MILWVQRVSLLLCFIKNVFQLLILSLRFDFWLSHPIEEKVPSGYEYTCGREVTREPGSSLCLFAVLLPTKPNQSMRLMRLINLFSVNRALVPQGVCQLMNTLNYCKKYK